MIDDLNNLKSLMDVATPKPDATRRAANMALAQNRFSALQQVHPATGGGLWHRIVTWLQSRLGKGMITASVALIAAGLFLGTPPVPAQLDAPATVASRIDKTTQESLVTEFAAPAGLIAADDAPVASRATATREQSLPTSNSYEAIRAAISRGVLPAKGDVRIDEMINAFTYDFAMISTDVNFATAIAGFGQLLHDPQAFGSAGYDPVIALAQSNLGPDVSGKRAEAVRTMQQASDLTR